MKKPEGRKKVNGILLAVFLAPWNWVYTYKYDAAKFWWSFAICILFFWTGFAALGIWIWAIIDMATKPDKLYEDYNIK